MKNHDLTRLVELSERIEDHLHQFGRIQWTEEDHKEHRKQQRRGLVGGAVTGAGLAAGLGKLKKKRGMLLPGAILGGTIGAIAGDASGKEKARKRIMGERS